MKDPRHPTIIAGCIREHVERLAAKIPASTPVQRLQELVDELDAAINHQQFSDSVALLSSGRGLTGGHSCVSKTD